MEIPSITTTTLATAATGSGTYVYDMRGTNIASLQLNSTFDTPAATDVITLKISNDGVNFVAFSTNKTVTLTGGTTDHALFELGVIDYAFLQVDMAAPSAGTLTVVGVLYATATITREA
jgi:hypothetical protein